MAKKLKIRGITLLESILAVGLIMSVVISSITIGIYTTRLGRSSNNKIIALNLAREGIEYVRNLRDSNWLKDLSWNDGLVEGDHILNQYLDTDPEGNYTWISGLTELTGSVSKELKINSDGVYNHDAGEGTIFSRSIKITISDYIAVISRVEWQENNQPKSFVLEEHLYNWREN